MARISLQEAYDQARRWIESDDPERAIGLAQHILTQFPDNLEAFRILGEAHIADRQLDQAQAAFERVLQSDPENVPAHVGLGIAYERQGRLDRAIPEFEQAWEIKPEMTELRSQLLRLYADAWGSEHAQLRLRGGGLARLYAKGHMLPQAIAEFRKVIDDQPERADAKVALAEALWRNGQEDDARDLSRQLLGEQPKLLKPNLLLGYVELASGSANGQHYWDTAHTMDPYETVAQAMFETLPSSDDDAPMIEEWDEQSWRELRQQEQQELDATRPIPMPSAEETDAASDSWLDRVPATVPPPPPPRNASVNPADNDDFLAGLLGMPEPSSMAASDDTATAHTFDDDDIDVSPFSFNELGLSDDEIASLDTVGQSPDDAASAASVDGETDTTTPFSAADLGLSDEDITGLDLGERTDDSAAHSETTSEDENAPDAALEDGSLEPFSLAELGLSEGEFSDLDAIGTSATLDEPETDTTPAVDNSAAQQAEIDDLSEGLASGSIAPFSFADLGLSDDELAALDLGEADADESAADPDAISEDFLRGQAGPDAEPTEAASTQPAEIDDLSEGLASGSIAPFSFADLGLSEDELTALDLGEDAAEPTDAANTQQAEIDDLSEGLASGSIAPFSFADLGLSDDEIASLNEIGDAPGADADATTPSAESDDGIEADVQPFSLSDLGLSDEELDNLNDLGDTATDTPRAGGSFGDTTENEYELPDDLQPFSLDELDISAADASDLGSGGLPTSLQPFSLDELTESRTDAPKRPAQDEGFSRLPDAPEDESSQQTGGYSWQEPLQRPQPSFVSSMNKEEQGEGASIFAKLKQRKQEEPIEPVQESTPAVSEVDDRLLFSFDNISLRDGDLGDAHTPVESAAMLDDAADNQTMPEATPQTQTDAPENIGDAVATGEIQPFSLSDLGLSEEEIAALGLGNAAAAPAEELPQQAQPQAFGALPDETPVVNSRPPESENLSEALESGEVQPFSFADLGLSEDEIASLGMGEAEQPREPIQTPNEPREVENLSEALESGEVQPFSFADLGLSEDEIASLDLGEAEPIQTPNEPREVENLSEALESGEVQPFSFADLGLSEDEIASLGMGEAEQPGEPTQTPGEIENLSEALESGEVQPFSFADLGLSEDEIASLGMGEAEPTNAPGERTASDESSFLADFNLEEAASAPEASAQPADEQQDALEDDLQPFSLSDLGFSDDELDAFGVNEPDGGKQPGGLDLTEDDLAGLDFGTPAWMTTSQEQPPQPPVADTPVSEPPASDAVVDRLIALGQQQGYVDVSDIIASIGDAETDESRVETVVQELQDANIQIRDGDEIIDLSGDDELDGADELDLAPSSQAAAADEADLTPFSLAELGLSDDEIASLGLADVESSPAASASEPAAPEPAGPVAQAEPSLPPALAGYMQQLEGDPQNHILRLSIARAVGQAGMADMSVQQYRHLIKQNALLDVIVDDIRDLLDEVDDTSFLQRLHRLLGDAYSKQGRLVEAMTEYAWVAP